MIKIAMIDIHKKIITSKMRSRMILQVHDELVFDAFIGELDELKDIVHDGMQNALKMSVPVVVDMNTGDNWLKAH
jgi:DNA polymerase-1